MLRFFCVSGRINGHLVALKVIHMKTEEGIPFTAIREGKCITHTHSQPRNKSAYTHVGQWGKMCQCVYKLCCPRNYE